ncbi:hypothetical protein, variant 5 [Aphanomyces astaci]|uniref:Uncharacterized protein n=1 Tax=Aphanomyces astaci TaxID=112090 RepID=W4FZW1_APHAT|nr:hypothetical protein, variant 6 [Aphanomyces astaci]XP_009837458.1 hypothetical protein, variant 7 [Aphanomyces astaci]XP_009837459.1 hypothetical protein, variant 4 [Aphanomyces astaci]XP_009837461.1 hypothetical protein, variant 5 [Aphanomyces astaci]ETV73012.1 hypothetical protein, variant 4 [Aphanomyces astaci]ETV73013.1 hypothetical protein, variant 5 [Aphanomyces astaci]ETV73014.1 hypothetical protein, variant 6 [Aphanomyces astaci]ETV73015.1 hypothetical protein, variant 7 [Aphanom|eukprot:XP_009837457.1 hypothetical protein, variant 6 [Aphanomyces astaci]
MKQRRFLAVAALTGVMGVVMADGGSSAVGYARCMKDSSCMPLNEIPAWWVCMQGQAVEYLILAGAMIFFATFLPRVTLSFMLFILGKFPFVREIVDDYVKFCTTSTTYLLSATLCMGAAIVGLLSPYLCRFHIYIWGIFFLMWIYSVFNVIDRLAIRRFGGKAADNSKKVVISESIKLLRLLVLVIVSMYIYLQMWQDQSLLKYSFLGMLGGAIALGFAGAVRTDETFVSPKRTQHCLLDTQRRGGIVPRSERPIPSGRVHPSRRRPRPCPARGAAVHCHLDTGQHECVCSEQFLSV